MFIAIATLGCGDKPASEHENIGQASDNGKGSVAISIQWPESRQSENGYSSKAARMNCAGISTVEVQIYGPPPANTQLIPPWREKCDVGNGTINDIPPTNNTTVVFVARNQEDQIVYYGSSNPVNILAGRTAAVSITAENFVPDLISPQSGDAPQLSVNCQWNAIPKASRYELRVSENERMQPYQRFIIQSNAMAPTGISAGTTYWCQVVAMDRYGNISNGSNIRSFSVLLGAPTLDSPGQGAVVLPGGVSLSWHGPAEGLFYRIDIATDTAFTNILHHIDTGLGVLSYTLDNITTDQTYY